MCSYDKWHLKGQSLSREVSQSRTGKMAANKKEKKLRKRCRGHFSHSLFLSHLAQSSVRLINDILRILLVQIYPVTSETGGS